MVSAGEAVCVHVKLPAGLASGSSSACAFPRQPQFHSPANLYFLLFNTINAHTHLSPNNPAADTLALLSATSSPMLGCSPTRDGFETALPFRRCILVTCAGSAWPAGGSLCHADTVPISLSLTSHHLQTVLARQTILHVHWHRSRSVFQACAPSPPSITCGTCLSLHPEISSSHLSGLVS